MIPMMASYHQLQLRLPRLALTVVTTQRKSFVFREGELALNGSHFRYIHDDEGSMYDDFALSQTVQVCPGLTYHFTFWAFALQADYCYLTSSFNGAGSVAFEYGLGTSYQQFGTTYTIPAGVTQVTVTLSDTNCFGNFYVDDFSFAPT